MSSPEWILAVGRLKLFLYLEESPGLSLVVDPVEAGEGDVSRTRGWQVEGGN